MFFTGSRQGSPSNDLERLLVAMVESSLSATEFRDTRLPDWNVALRFLARALPDELSIVVLDEFPWLCQNDTALEGTLQAHWDHVFEFKPVLMILVGSDLSVMNRITGYDRPLFGRATEMVVNSLNPAETAAMLELEPADALDAYLVTGGYPRLLTQWPRGVVARDYVTEQLTDPSSDLITVGQRIVAAEFPSEIQAGRVLRAVGSGERSFGNLRQELELQPTSLNRSLTLLENEKRVVGKDIPTSPKPAKDARYRIADTYLRFWLRFVEPAVPDIERDRPDLPLTRLWDAWPDYRGRAIEPIVREALVRIAYDDERLGGAGYVGGWWPRNNNPEVDLVGVERTRRPRKVCFVGSIKWGDRRAFTDRDLQQLTLDRAAVPGAEEAPLVCVTRTSQAFPTGLAASYGPADIVGAWAHQIGL